jgi:TonB family protein
VPHDPNLVHSYAPTTNAPAQAAPAEATNDAMPHFTIAVDEATTAYGAVSSLGSTPPQEGGIDAAPMPEALVDGRARLVAGVSPAYSDAARADGIEGDVRVELVVGVSGAVESARVVLGIGHGLDEAALRAVRQYRFAPALKAGRPVRVRMAWSMQFRLR